MTLGTSLSFFDSLFLVLSCLVLSCLASSSSIHLFHSCLTSSSRSSLPSLEPDLISRQIQLHLVVQQGTLRTAGGSGTIQTSSPTTERVIGTTVIVSYTPDKAFPILILHNIITGMRFSRQHPGLLALGALLAGPATAQTWSSCNPLNTSKSPDGQAMRQMGTFQANESTLF
jgi:hypothetical protein